MSQFQNREKKGARKRKLVRKKQIAQKRLTDIAILMNLTKSQAQENLRMSQCRKFEKREERKRKLVQENHNVSNLLLRIASLMSHFPKGQAPENLTMSQCRKFEKKKGKKKKTGSKKAQRIKSPDEDSESDEPAPKRKNKKKKAQPVETKTPLPPSEDSPRRREPSPKDENILDLDIFSEPAQKPMPTQEPSKTSADDEWADFATADTAAPDSKASSATSAEPAKIDKEEPASDSWMGAFGPPPEDPNKGISEAMGLFAGYGGTASAYGQAPHGAPTMFQPNRHFYPSATSQVPVASSDMGQAMASPFEGLQIGGETKVPITTEPAHTDKKEVSKDKDPFADLMAGTDVGEEKHSPSPKYSDKSSSQSSPASTFPFSGIGSGGVGTSPKMAPTGMSQMPGSMPQMSGGIPQMSGGIPQMSGPMPTMSQMPGGMPQMSGGMSQMNQQQAAAMMQMYQQQAQMQAQMYQRMYYAQQFLQQQHQNQGQQQGQQMKTPRQNTGSLPK